MSRRCSPARRGLTAEGHDVEPAFDGIAAMTAAKVGAFDVAILDVMLPGMSGLELSRRLKEHDPTIAVILLTARDAVDDRVRGLRLGRTTTWSSRSSSPNSRLHPCRAATGRAVDALDVMVAGLTIDLHRHRFHVGNREVALSRTEFDVLRVLAVTRARP